MRLAAERHIPVFNLFRESDLAALRQLYRSQANPDSSESSQP
jgi:hypothetical protein